MSVNDARWAEIRRAYLDCSETIAQIAERTGVSVRNIQRRVKAEDWPRRSQRRSVAQGAGKRTGDREVSRKADGRDGVGRGGVQLRAALNGTEPGRTARQASAKPMHVIKRLYRALDLKLTKLEQRMQASDELTAADSEREARELSSMIRSFEKVTEVAAEIDKSRKQAGRRGRTVRAEDAERMRSEIAERIERLRTTGLHGAVSGRTE